LINKVFDKFCSQNGEAEFRWRNDWIFVRRAEMNPDQGFTIFQLERRFCDEAWQE
jgi:hypothetical protein